MKNTRKREVALIASGIVLGVTITGPAAQAAEMLTAQRPTQKIYVDGQRVQLEAYSINGNNYAKLRFSAMMAQTTPSPTSAGGR